MRSRTGPRLTPDFLPEGQARREPRSRPRLEPRQARTGQGWRAPPPSELRFLTGPLLLNSRHSSNATMPFVHLPERGVNQYYCTNPTWHYSTSLSTAPITGVLDPKKPNLLLIHACGSSSAAQQRQFHDERLKSTFNMIALDASFCGWTTGAQREGEYPMREVAEDFLCAIDKLYAPDKIKFSIIAEGYLGSTCASWMAVS